MFRYAGPLLNTFLSLSIGMWIRYYPLRGRLRVPLKALAAIYVLVFAAQCAAFVVMQERFAADYMGNQMFKTLSGIVILMLPFLLTRRGFFQNLFLLTIVAHYVIVVFGVANYVEMTHGGAFAESFPYLICDGVVIALSVPVLPFVLRLLDRLFKLWPQSGARVWRFIWIIPAVFAMLCMMVANVFMGEGAVDWIFVTVRVLISVGMVVTCWLLFRMLKRETQAAALNENARMMEAQLILQREQYAALARHDERERAARHDLRHHFTVMKKLSGDGDLKKLDAYIGGLAGSLAPGRDQRFCANYAVNAVANHYLSLCADEDTAQDIRLDIPEEAGSISDMDLCVVMGNLLENAVEATGRMGRGGRFIRMTAEIRGRNLFIVMDNSYDGELRMEDGAFLSSKRGGAGIGLASIKSVAEKYGGSAGFEARDGVFASSVMLRMGDGY